MSWNYRIIRREVKGADYIESTHGIHEVYYDETKQPHSWSKDPIEPHGETIEDIKADYHMMGAAFNKPILKEVTNDKGEEKLETTI